MLLSEMILLLQTMEAEKVEELWSLHSSGDQEGFDRALQSLAHLQSMRGRYEFELFESSERLPEMPKVVSFQVECSERDGTLTG